MIVEEIVGVLRGLKREGLAILLVEQNLRAAFAVGDRHHIMNKGEICFTGTSAEIESNEDRAAELSQCLTTCNPALRSRRSFQPAVMPTWPDRDRAAAWQKRTASIREVCA